MSSKTWSRRLAQKCSRSRRRSTRRAALISAPAAIIRIITIIDTRRLTILMIIMTMITAIMITKITITRTARITTSTTTAAAIGATMTRRTRGTQIAGGERAVSRGRTKRPSPPAPVVTSRCGIADDATLFRLLTWLSPSFPVGAFSYSSGIERAVEAGDVGDASTLQDWLSCMLTDGSGFCDAVFLCHAYRAASDQSGSALREVAELAAAFVSTRERHLETTAQGRAFVEITCETWPCEALERLLGLKTAAIAYPVAVGVVSAGHRVPLAATVHGFLHALAANWISAGVRLIPLGQTAGQRVLAALEPAARTTAERALQASLDDLGSATLRADIASMRHEAQYTRLFRS